MGQMKTYTCTRVRTGTDKVRPLDTRMTRLMPEEQDVEKVVCDAQDGTMSQVELFLPC